MDEDTEGDVRSLDITALGEIREEFLALDWLVDYASFDSLLDPTELRIDVDDGDMERGHGPDIGVAGEVD